MYIAGKFVVFDNLFHSEGGEFHQKGDRVEVERVGPEHDKSLHRISETGARAGEAFRKMVRG